MSANVPDLQELVCTQRVPVLWPVGCEADTLFYVKVSDAERLLKEIRRLQAIVARLPTDAEGNPVTPEAELVATHYGEICRPRMVCDIHKGGWRFYGSSWYAEGDADRACYGSTEAAEKARTA